MMLGETPTVNQRSPRDRVVALDQHARHGLGAAREDTHLVVDELDVLDVLLVAAEVLAQRPVERVDRAVAFADRPQRLVVAVDEHLDDRLRHGDQLAARVVAPLDHDAEAVDGEIARHALQRAPRQQLEGGFRRLVGIADGLARLHLVEQPRDARVVLADGDAQPFDRGEDVRLAGLLGDEQTALVADALRRARARRSAGSFRMAEAWMPALVANALSPT